VCTLISLTHYQRSIDIVILIAIHQFALCPSFFPVQHQLHIIKTDIVHSNMTNDNRSLILDFATSLNVSQSLLSHPSSVRKKVAQNAPCTTRGLDIQSNLSFFNENDTKVCRLPARRFKVVDEHRTNVFARLSPLEDSSSYSRKHHLDPDEIMPSWELQCPSSPASQKKRPRHSTTSHQENDCNADLVCPSSPAVKATNRHWIATSWQHLHVLP